MTRRILVSATVACMAMACGSSALPSAEIAPSAPRATMRAKLTKKTRAPVAERAPRELLHAGDVFVHRYEGAFRKTPLMLTEKVVSVEGDFAVIDLTLTEGKKSDHLRVKRSLVDRGIRNVWRMAEGGQETEVGIYVYDELMAKTAFAADSNEGTAKNKDETCLVGQKEISCLVTQYDVYVGGKPATLTVATSDALPGRDLSGSITDEAGKVLYKAELVEMSQGSDASVASRE